jgi:hypothetical protein
LTGQQAVAELLSDETVDLAYARRGKFAQPVDNRRLPIARSILRNDAERGRVQETYVRAFTGLEPFRGDAAFGTWITGLQ